MTAAASLLHGPGRGRSRAGSAPLDPSALQIDARTLPQLLAMAPEFAKLLNFIDLKGEQRGDWVAFFEHEMLFLLAEVATAGEAGAEAQVSFEACLARAGCGSGEPLDNDIVDHVLALAGRIGGWRQRAERIDAARLPAPGGELTVTLATVIKHDLAPRLRDGLARGLRDGLDPERTAAIDALETLWRPAVREDSAGDVSVPVPVPVRVAVRARRRAVLVKLLTGFTEALCRLARLACAYLDDEIANRTDHAPHASLYVAFIQMQQLLQADLNGFGARHLDYYYKTVLQLAERAAVPDQVDVMFELVPHVDSLVLAAGTTLTAGRDADGAEVLYATGAALAIGQAKLRQVKTMFLQQARHGDWVGHVYVTSRVYAADGKPTPPVDQELGWATFGELPVNAAAALQAGDFGMQIGSPVLMLAGGVRRVTVRLELEEEGFPELHEQFLEAVGRQTPMTPTDALRAGSALFVSCGSGWYSVSSFDFKLDEGPGIAPALVLSFTLERDTPALVANPALFPAVSCPWPLLKLMQKPKAPVCLYSFHAGLQVRAARIEVEVSDLPGLVIEGAAGPVAPAKPFAPFGVLAQCGLGFEVGHPELAVKQLDHLALSLDWPDLLNGAASLSAYYAGYPMPFDDAVFTVRVERRRGGRWEALADGAALPLFPNGCRHSDFSFDLTPSPGASTAPAVPDVAPGTLRVVLTSPTYAFGQASYPALFADISLRNTAALLQAVPATAGAKPPPLTPMVTAPLAPLVAAVTLGYSAHDRLDLSDGAGAGSCFHLTPFGYCARSADMGALMQDIARNEGHLYLGLDGLRAPATLTLYFELREQGAAKVVLPGRGGAGLAPQWRYLAGDTWRDFPAHGVVSHTDGFTRSGTVELQVPSDISLEHTLMPGGLCWISVQVSRGAAKLCRTVRIIPHAVRAQRCEPVARPGVPAVLAPGTITALAKKIAPVAKVVQPFASFGGRAAETAPAFRVRVSERLRHKRRASRPADFEALVLELFPAVRQVKCSTPNNSCGYPAPSPGMAGSPPIAPGDVVITVAATTALDGEAMLMPLPRYLLDDIGRTLQACCSPFVSRLTVRNPLLEGVTVSVSLSLKANHGQNDASGLLNRAISDFIAPWRSDEARLIDLGCRTLYAWEMLEMIQNQPYVDQVGTLSMVHRTGPGRHQLRWIDEGGCITPGSPWTVLVPHSQHEIRIGAPDQARRGIGGMTVGADFHVDADAVGTVKD